MIFNSEVACKVCPEASTRSIELWRVQPFSLIYWGFGCPRFSIALAPVRDEARNRSRLSCPALNKRVQIERL